MRVIQVVADVKGESAGPSYSVPGMCRGLMAAGVEVELHSLPPQREFAFPHVTYESDRWSPRRLGFSREMKRGLARECRRADVIHSNGLWMMPDVYPPLAARGTACKSVVSPRGAIAAWTLRKNRFVKKVFGALWQWPALRAADMFHATSVKEYEEIRRAGFRQPVALIPIGMDVVTCGRTRGEAGPKRIVFFGRLHDVKKVDHLLLAWSQVAGELPDWEVQIAGPDFGVKGALERLVAEMRIPRVTFVGEITGPAKYRFLADADLCVLPSLSENFGITVAEALMCRVPVIASRGCPWEGLVTHRCGWWTDIGAEPIAEALRAAAALGDAARREMGARGRQWIVDDFSWEGIGEKTKRAYDWLLGRGEKGAEILE